jgi:hypothetical protein
MTKGILSPLRSRAVSLLQTRFNVRTPDTTAQAQR